jgi:hypothetical protein
MSVIASTVANTIPRTKKTKDKVFKPDDFMPKFQAVDADGEPIISDPETETPQGKRMSVDQSIQFMEILNARFGGKDLRGGQVIDYGNPDAPENIPSKVGETSSSTPVMAGDD